MKRYLILLFVLSSACATHAPMSEMVMFEKATIPDSVEYLRSGTVTYIYPGITYENFEDSFDGDFASYSEFSDFPSITVNTFKLRRDGTARSLSFGRGLGIDWTKKLKSSFYGTLAISTPLSLKTSAQSVILNRRWAGLSGGLFIAFDSRLYNDICGEEACNFWPDRSAFLFNSGFRSRFLIRDPRSPGITITGSFEGGFIWNTFEPIIGFNVSMTSLK